MKVPPWRRLLVRQWAWLLAALLAATTLAYLYGVFWRTDFSIYDAALAGGPAPSDVVIVAVDDASVAQLGRWPWRRALYAALLDRLRAAGAKVVALDFFLTEPDSNLPNGDAALAAAMMRGPPTVLPMMVEMPQAGGVLHERLPLPELLRAAAGMGHANLEIDRDGIVRSVFLREGLGVPNRLYLAAAVLDSIRGAAPVRLRGARNPDPAGRAGVWVRDYHMLIPFLGPPGHFARVSAVDVLRGSVSESALRGKIVLVGATAQGIGDAYPTPRSGQGTLMSGVEVTANVLQALRSNTLIQPVSMGVTIVLALLPICLGALGFLRLPPRQSLVLAMLLWLGTLGASVLALRLFDWWWPPTASLAGLLVMYPLWSWRRLEATQAYFEQEFTRLAKEGIPLLGALPATAPAGRPLDYVQQRIELLRYATRRLGDARRLFADMISSLPDATLLADADGRIVLANPAAAELFELADCRMLEGTPVDTQLYQRVQLAALRFSTLAAGAPCTVEAAMEGIGRQVLIRAVACYDSSRMRIGTIIDLADITELRAVQREREDVVRFLSHDMKSPAASLLGLAQLQRDPQRALPAFELSQRLDLLAQRLLTLVDGFVSLARAESVDPRVFEDFDLRDALQDACDEVWATAQARDMTIVSHLPEAPLVVHGDRHLLARAIVNLLGNAIKFSPPGAGIQLHGEQRDRNAVVSVADQGPGIAPESRVALFQRYSRRAHRGSADPGGAGLGLAFVRVVAEKHHGHVWVEGTGESGSTFCLSVSTVSSAP